MKKINLKEFGIYTNEEYIFIIVEINDRNVIKGIRFPISQFDDISNDGINKSLLSNWISVGAHQKPFIIDLKRESDFFDNYGYLGQINNQEFQKLIKSHIKLFGCELEVLMRRK